ncbi:alpha/beta fold hydrolase [Sphingosinicella terrae]|uniref:alpha/beta fold hydrolase n=1 Tax=Sphingosinicella terrae TaxID=2172047 RepID=UPI000E0D5D1E|nr:alpha/beta hydrolase [Sphingosinicella terrae]
MTTMARRRTHPPDAVFAAWPARDGWPLRRMDWSQPAGSRARGSLLFANGRGDFIEKYLEACAHWHDAGWNVTAFDWRGQGLSRSDDRRRRPRSFQPMVRDLGDLVADWRGGSPGPHVAVAHSMGGHLLLRLLVDQRRSLDAAVLVAPMIRVNSAPLPERFAPLITEMMCLGRRHERLVWKVDPTSTGAASRRERHLTRSPERYADELWWWDREPRLRMGGVTWGWLRAAYRSAGRFTVERLARVRTPILLIGSDRDRLVSAAAIRRAAADLPDAELHMYPDAAHEILREADPVRLDALARIDAFFGRRVAGAHLG